MAAELLRIGVTASLEDAQSGVQKHVIGLVGTNHEIIGTIIAAILVDVMNHCSGWQSETQYVFDNVNVGTRLLAKSIRSFHRLPVTALRAKLPAF